MDEQSASDALSLGLQYHFPLMDSHTGIRDDTNCSAGLPPNTDERSIPYSQITSLGTLGGVLGLGTATNTGPDAVESWLQNYKKARSLMGGTDVALGTDFNGLSPQIQVNSYNGSHPQPRCHARTSGAVPLRRRCHRDVEESRNRRRVDPVPGGSTVLRLRRWLHQRRWPPPMPFSSTAHSKLVFSVARTASAASGLADAPLRSLILPSLSILSTTITPIWRGARTPSTSTATAPPSSAVNSRPVFRAAQTASATRGLAAASHRTAVRCCATFLAMVTRISLGQWTRFSHLGILFKRKYAYPPEALLAPAANGLGAVSSSKEGCQLKGAAIHDRLAKEIASANGEQQSVKADL